MPDLDENTSFFAVFDGHGGKEVALYAGRHLPRILRETESYKTKLNVALKESFMKIDEVMQDKSNAQELAELSGRRKFRDEDDGNEKGADARSVNKAIQRALKESLLAEGSPEDEVDLIVPSLEVEEGEGNAAYINKNGENDENGKNVTANQ